MTDPTGRMPEPLERLGDELLAAADRYRYQDAATARRTGSAKRRVFSVAAAALIVVGFVVAGTVAGPDEPAAADVKVERDGDTVRVSIAATVTVDSVDTALERAGVDADVVGQATGPSRLNQFVGLIAPPGSRLVGGDTTSAPTAEFEVGSDVTLLIGVTPANPGDPYDVPTKATDRGEPLAGSAVAGNAVEQFQALVERMDRRLSVSYRNPAGQPTGTPPSTAIVDAALMFSATDLVVFLR